MLNPSLFRDLFWNPISYQSVFRIREDRLVKQYIKTETTSTTVSSPLKKREGTFFHMLLLIENINRLSTSCDRELTSLISLSL